MTAERLKLLCPKCGQFGFVSERWVTSSYYPMLASVYTIMIKHREEQLAEDPNNSALEASLESFKRKVVGNVFRGRSEKDLTRKVDSENIPNKKSFYKVTYGKYEYLYVGHYDKEKYKEQMKKYRDHKIKSRPNGRRWCKLPRYFRECQIVNDRTGKHIKFIRSPHPMHGRKI